jgi:hypothetical protein
MAAPAIGRRRRWSPPITAKVDWSCELAAGLVACHLPCGAAGAIDLCGGSTLLPSGSQPGAVTPFGRAMENTVGNNGYQYPIGTTHPLAIQPPLSLLWVGSMIAAPNDYSQFYGQGLDNADNPPYVGALITALTSQWRGTSQDAPSTFNQAIGGSTSIGPHVVVQTVSATATKIFDNGIEVGSGGGSTSFTYAATSYFAVNYSIAAPTRPTQSGFNMGAMWRRALSAREITALAADPFSFLRF